jgi:hypothetical protein
MAQTPPDPTTNSEIPILNEEEDDLVCFGSDSNIDTTEKSQRLAEQVCPGPPRSRSRVHSGPPAPPILNEEEDEVCFGSDPNIDKVKKIQEDSLDSFPSPSPSVKIQIMGGKGVKAKPCCMLSLKF